MFEGYLNQSWQKSLTSVTSFLLSDLRLVRAASSAGRASSKSLWASAAIAPAKRAFSEALASSACTALRVSSATTVSFWRHRGWSRRQKHLFQNLYKENNYMPSVSSEFHIQTMCMLCGSKISQTIDTHFNGLHCDFSVLSSLLQKWSHCLQLLLHLTHILSCAKKLQKTIKDKFSQL